MDIFKFYVDDEPSGDHKPLSEEDYGRFISKTAARRVPAITRQMSTLIHASSHELISLAEGLPNEEVYPFDWLGTSLVAGGTLDINDKELITAMGYLPTQGLPTLVSELRALQRDLHRPPPLPRARDVIVTNGGQHGLYLILDLLLNEGDPLLVTEYIYNGFAVALKAYDPELINIPEDSLGIVPEKLDTILSDRQNRGLRMPRLLYLVPTANNPSGTTLPTTRRHQIYGLACKYDFLILEDDPYMFLNYDDEPLPSFLSMDEAGRVLRVDSISKVMSAGMRVGWLTAPAPLLQKIEQHMQIELAHSCAVSQSLTYRLIANRGEFFSHMKRARSLYQRRRDALLAAMGPLESLADWVVPNGGLFLWLKVRDVHDVYDMVIERAIKQGLLLLPGQAFLYDDSATSQYVRLTYSKVPLKDMDAAIRHLADIIRDEQSLCLRRQTEKLTI